MMLITAFEAVLQNRKGFLATGGTDKVEMRS